MGKIQVRPYTALFPCPVILVTCMDKDKNPNVITLAWAGNICSDPPQVGISIRPSRFSHSLIKESKEFVINIPGEELLKETDYCGVVSGSKVDKFEYCGFTKERSSRLDVPMIKECPVNMECSVGQVIPLGTHDLFISEVLAVHIDEDYCIEKNNYPDYEKIKPFIYCPHDYLSTGNIIGYYGFSKKR